jgi:hypothetical protein
LSKTLTFSISGTDKRDKRKRQPVSYYNSTQNSYNQNANDSYGWNKLAILALILELIGFAAIVAVYVIIFMALGSPHQASSAISSGISGSTSGASSAFNTGKSIGQAVIWIEIAVVVIGLILAHVSILKSRREYNGYNAGITALILGYASVGSLLTMYAIYQIALIAVKAIASSFGASLG